MRKTLKQLHEEFVREAKYSARRSSKTVEAYIQAFSTLTKVMPSLMMEQLTPEMITEFFQRLETRERIVGRGEIRIGVKNSTIQSYRSKLGAFFTWLVKKGHLEENPLGQISRPSIYYDSIEYLKKEKIERILATINFNIKWESNLIRKRNECIILLGLCCGLRRNEMLNISLNDIDLQRKVITIRVETSKSRHTREVPINDQLLPRLMDYLEERRRHGIKTHILIASGRNDSKLSLCGFKHMIDKIKEVSGVKFHYHQLRHTFAMNYLRNGNNVFMLKQVMGHTDIRMTDKYVRRLPTNDMVASVQGIRIDNLL